MTSLMPREKTWEKEGVIVTFLSYDTMRKKRVREMLYPLFQYPAPTDENPDRVEVPVEVYIFYAAMPCILKVELPEVSPIWGQMLKEEIESSSWLNDPVADYTRFEKFAPDTLLMDCYEGFKATRETAYVAPPELQSPQPVLSPEDTELVLQGEDIQTTENPTSSLITDGTQSLNMKLLKGRVKLLNDLQQTAK